MILESGFLTSTNPDLLSAGRLNAIPYNGLLTMQFISDHMDATGDWTLTIQKPNGDVPVDAQKVPGAINNTVGVLDDRALTEFKFQATQGGHFTVALTLAGTAVCSYRIVLTP